MSVTSSHHMGFAKASKIAAIVRLNEQEQQARTSQMANAMLELRGSNGHATQDDLRKLGFSTAEIVSFGQDARELAVDRGISRTSAFPGQILDQFRYWAKCAILAKQPQYGNSQQNSDECCRRWKRYCNSMTAFQIDPSESQKDRCILQLCRFLEMHPMPEFQQRSIRQHIAAHLKNALKLLSA